MRTILAVACGLGVAGAALVVACGGSDGSGDLIGPAPDGSADATLTPTGSDGGGGGGGGNFSGAANVQINAEPKEIDAGDHMRIRTFVSDIHENGIALKFQFPAKMTFAF